MARRGAEFGVSIEGQIGVDMKQVKARKDAIVKQSNQGVTNWLKSMENLTLIEGHGRLESANTVRVNGELLEADKIGDADAVLCATPDYIAKIGNPENFAICVMQNS